MRLQSDKLKKNPNINNLVSIVAATKRSSVATSQGKTRWKLNFLDLGKIKQKDEIKKKETKENNAKNEKNLKNYIDYKKNIIY